MFLEAATSGAVEQISRDEVVRLLHALDRSDLAGVLHSPGRYALQVTTTAARPGDALVRVLGDWADALHELKLPAWEIVRAEVVTPEEFERELNDSGEDRVVHFGPPVPAHSAAEDLGGELLRRAFSDPLTGLLGREAFMHRLEDALTTAEAPQSVTVLCLGLDGVRNLNDRYGDRTWDQVLVGIAQRLAAGLRADDSLGRIAEDEYGVILVSEHDVEAVAHRMLEAMRQPVRIKGDTVTVLAAAGVARGGPDEDAPSVVAKAEAALKAATEAGDSRPVLFRQPMSPLAAIRHRRVTRAGQDPLAHLLLLLEVAVAANEADTLEEAAAAVMRHTCSHLECAVGHLLVLPEDHAKPPYHLWHTAGPGDYQTFRDATQLTPGLIAEHAMAAGLQSAFAFPVLVGGKVVAVLEFFSRTTMELTGLFPDVLGGIGTQLGRVVERQRSAAASRRSENLLREAQRMARLGSWRYDLSTGKATWSDEMCAIHGLEPGDAPPALEGALESFHPADRDRCRAALARLIAGEPTALDVRIVRGDGTVRWLRTEGRTLQDADGRTVAIYGTSQDITESKTAEEALRRSERQRADAQRVARLGWWERDISTNDVTWSEELYSMWGWDPGLTVTLDALIATVHPDDRQRVQKEFAQLNPREGPVSLDYRVLMADGQQRWFRARKQLMVDEDGTPTTVFGTTQDVTEEKQAERDLRSVTESYRQIVETAHEGILTLDPRGITTFANSRMAKILGYRVEELVGMPTSSFVDAETEAGLAGHRERRRAGISEHYETDLRASDGSVVRVLVSASPLLDDEGRFSGTLAMVTDVSALGEAEEVLRLEPLRDGASTDAL